MKNIIKNNTLEGALAKSFKIIALGIISSALITACTPPKTQKLDFTYIATNNTPANSTDKDAQIQLADAAQSINESLQQLAEVQRAVHPNAKPPKQLDANKIGMAQLASLDWTGPIQPLLNKIASSTHYKLKVIGEQPAIPVVISINAKNKPLADILRDATFQAGTKADVSVFPASKTIELRYYA